MNILILGSGAREHAIAKKFAESDKTGKLYVAPGNAGTAEIAENVGINSEDGREVADFAKKNGIDYVFVGHEAPLANGVVDVLNREKIAVFGAHKEAAKLESSKIFSKAFMNRHNISTAKAIEFDNAEKFSEYIKKIDSMVVVKKSGLAAGKGVLESDNINELLAFGLNILKDDKLLVEEYLTGYEISLFTVFDGKNYVNLPPAADFKKAKEGDLGSNTGGMGAITPVPNVDKSLLCKIDNEIIKPTINGIIADKLSFKGVIFTGLMITKNGPKVLEYNIRFGDPETQPLLSLIDSDFTDFNQAIIDSKLDKFDLKIKQGYAVGVVVAAAGYPGDYEKNIEVDSIPKDKSNCYIFHASTVLKNGKTLTQGGRCFTAVGVDATLAGAINKAYEGADRVKFKGSWSRRDIGKKFLEKEV